MTDSGTANSHRPTRDRSQSGAMGDLRVVVCGGGAAGGVVSLITEASGRGWAVDVTATRNALDFIDCAEVARVSHKPVRTTYKFAADGRRISPPADALIVAPATFNTVNKLAAGIADTYALSSVAEVIGRGVPTVVVPAVNSALASRLPFRRAIDDLRSEGVRVLFGPDDDWEPLPPGRNDPRRFPWIRALDLVEDAFGLTTVDSGVAMRA
jgi:phosphopantothenoylcysteine synthetase/decarboxylase